MIEINTQSSIKIDNIYFDPYKIEKESHDAKIIFITHPHYDHFDIKSIDKIKNEKTLFIVPNDQSIISELQNDNIIIVDPNKEYEIEGIKFKTVPAYNINKSFHKKEYNWVGYVVYLDKIYYIMGDTDDTIESREVKCDYLFIPIGGTYTMNYKEASDLTNTINPKIVTPIHYGCIVGDKADENKFKRLINKNIEVKVLLK